MNRHRRRRRYIAGWARLGRHYCGGGTGRRRSLSDSQYWKQSVSGWV